MLNVKLAVHHVTSRLYKVNSLITVTMNAMKIKDVECQHNTTKTGAL